MSQTWSREQWERSLTSRAWAATSINWEEMAKLGQAHPWVRDARAIFEEEMAVGAVPGWAVEVVERMIGVLAPCGHYTFPRPLLQVCEAIGRKRCPGLVLTCYTADSARKRLLAYYVFCLDAWLKGAPLEVAAAELALRDSLGKDWAAIIAAVYATLGAPSPEKVLLIRRLVHRLRWWIKTLIWTDDRRDRYLLDVYSGDIRGEEVRWDAYGNSPFGDPYFVERELPGMKELAASIRERVPGGDKLLVHIESTWLCAPKAFRYLERIIGKIGSLGTSPPLAADAAILQCEGTYFEPSSCRAWFEPFMMSLDRWLEGDATARRDLGEATKVRRWLVRLFRLKLQLLAEFELGRLVGLRPAGRPGRRRPGVPPSW